jgi:hypothetical protein
MSEFLCPEEVLSSTAPQPLGPAAPPESFANRRPKNSLSGGFLGL